MGRFTRAKMNKQMTRDERAEKAIKRMPLKIIILMIIGAALLIVAYFMQWEDLYIGEIRVLPLVFGIYAILLVINLLAMGFRYAYHRGFKLKALLVPVCHGVVCFIAYIIIEAVCIGIDSILDISMYNILEVVIACALPGLIGAVLGWISRLLFRRRDI